MMLVKKKVTFWYFDGRCCTFYHKYTCIPILAPNFNWGLSRRPTYRYGPAPILCPTESRRYYNPLLLQSWKSVARLLVGLVTADATQKLLDQFTYFQHYVLKCCDKNKIRTKVRRLR